MEEEPVYEMKLTNGIGEQMLAHVFEKFDVELKQTEFGPKLQGTKEELEKAQEYIIQVMKERLEELDNRYLIILFTFFIMQYSLYKCQIMEQQLFLYQRIPYLDHYLHQLF